MLIPTCNVHPGLWDKLTGVFKSGRLKNAPVTQQIAIKELHAQGRKDQIESIKTEIKSEYEAEIEKLKKLDPSKYGGNNFADALKTSYEAFIEPQIKDLENGTTVMEKMLAVTDVGPERNSRATALQKLAESGFKKAEAIRADWIKTKNRINATKRSIDAAKRAAIEPIIEEEEEEDTTEPTIGGDDETEEPKPVPPLVGKQIDIVNKLISRFVKLQNRIKKLAGKIETISEPKKEELKQGSFFKDYYATNTDIKESIIEARTHLKTLKRNETVEQNDLEKLSTKATSLEDTLTSLEDSLK